MRITEYDKVKDYSYLQYCEYLQNKYGKGLCEYMTASWVKSRKVTRTKEGIFVHHKYEDQAIRLSHPEIAKNYPYEWQLPENLIYCDFLEHLFLHVLICEKSIDFRLGIGGLLVFMIPELNDWFSGFDKMEQWQKNCWNVIKNDEEVYLILLKRLKEHFQMKETDCIENLCVSFNESFGTWSKDNNKVIFEKIQAL